MGITPYLIYRDAAAAIDWLTDVFGFAETLRYVEDSGQVSHAELELPGGAKLMLGSTDDAGRPTGAPNAFLQVDVPDADAHHAHSVERGADVVRPLTDQPYGTRTYSVTDLEGFRWEFAQRVREVAPADWGAVTPD